MSLSLVSSRVPRTASTARPVTRTAARRDPAVDIARAVCLVVVVLLHALMVGVSVGASGPVLENAMEGWPGFAALSWIVQVMPLFFLLGGFSAHTQWERMRGRGAGYGDYLAGRMRRLFAPAAAALVAVAVLLSVLSLTGVPGSLVEVAGFRMSQPLWFLGVYVLCTAAVPPLVALHRRAPLLGLALPAALAIAIDVLRGSTGVPAIGFANLLFVWLTVQQLGFWLASGRLDGVRRRMLGMLAAAAAVLLALLCAAGVWSFDMLANLNPPTTALLLLAVVQLALFRLFAPTLRAVADLPLVERAVGWISARAMTVYLWHMPVLIVLAGALLVSGAELPRPLSGAWWLARPAWFVVVVIAVAGVVAVAGRFETGRPATPSMSPSASPRAILSASAGAGGVLLVLLAGASIASWVTAAGLAFLALRILRSSDLPGVVTR
ncbi:acyltransferase family protein [Leifsonia aquatica]|uniref:acyltransferase family protein n=1 Tax=Leifsonia aquatica TaxID=144185 RepID=UPI0028A6370A|nr:acyltransferase [Leifsonia aquatica]